GTQRRRLADQHAQLLVRKPGLGKIPRCRASPTVGDIMKKILLFAVLVSAANMGLAQVAATRPETPMLGRDEYRQRLDEVIVIGQDPYWRREGAPRWDRSKVEVDPKAAGEPRLKLFPNYTAEEADE